MSKSILQCLTIFISCLFIPAISIIAGEIEQKVEQPVKQAITTRQFTQKHEEQWRADKEKLIAHAELLEGQNKDLESEKKELKQTIASTHTHLADKQKQLDDITNITNGITPFLGDLYQQLQLIVSDAVPFLPAERQHRIEKIEPILTDPAIPVSEKYRKVMEALLVEAEYGYSYEVYQETIPLRDQSTLVNIFRLGRLNLFYLTLNKEQCGFYNVAGDAWQPLPLHNLPAIQTAVAIGLKRKPVELLKLPVGRIASR